MVLTTENLNKLQTIVRVAAGISLVASICLFIDLKRTWSTLRKSPSRMIFWWAISTTISLPAMLLGRAFIPQLQDEHPSPMCFVQGTILSFSFLSSILWAGCIAANLLIAIKWKFDVQVLMNAEIFYHKLCWGLPALSTIILMFLPNVYGDAYFWCWIDNRYAWLHPVYLNIPSSLTMVSSVFIYVLVGRGITRTFQLSSRVLSHTEGDDIEVQKRRIQATNRFALKCSLYLLAFILSHSGEVAVCISQLVSPDPPLSIYEMMAVTIPGSGAFIAAAYFATRFLKPPKGSFTRHDSFYSGGGSKLSSRIDLPIVTAVSNQNRLSMHSNLSGRTFLNDFPNAAGSSRGSTVPSVASALTYPSQITGSRNSAIIPSLPPSLYHINT